MTIPTLPQITIPINKTLFPGEADAFIAALYAWTIAANAAAVAMNLNSTNDTSASSVLIGTGSKSFTVSTGKSYQPGMYAVIADTAAPSTNSMFGQITSYDAATGALVMNITSFVGSGTKTAWVISQSSVGIGAVGRSRLINGNFAINQRAVSGTVVLAAGVYGHSGWKAGAAGCTYTFATVNNVTTITITAGSLIQVADGVNLQSGTHTLSWTGTAQGKIGAGSYAASGVTGVATGGTNLNVEFNTGTLSMVQLEFGSIPTGFEFLHKAHELAYCEWYLRSFTLVFLFGNQSGGGVTNGQSVQFPAMRANPTFSLTTSPANTNCFATTAAALSNTSMYFYAATSANGACQINYTGFGSAEL